MVKEAPASQNPGPDAKFFNVLEPRLSPEGTVKTFTVRAVPGKVLPKRKAVQEGETAVAEIPAPPLKWSGKGFLVPVSGNISSPFGYRKHPYRARSHLHTGIDIMAQHGTAIRAAGSGRVVYSGWKRGYGQMVEIDHGNGIRTVYAHCSRIRVKVGASIAAGMILGNVGRTGVATGPHLHFEVLRQGSFVNPLRYLSR